MEEPKRSQTGRRKDWGGTVAAVFIIACACLVYGLWLAPLEGMKHSPRLGWHSLLAILGFAFAASFLWAAVGIVRQRYAVLDRFRQGREQRTARATGTVIGGTPAGGIPFCETLHVLPVAEFETGEGKFYATGPIPSKIQKVAGDGASWSREGDVLYASAPDDSEYPNASARWNESVLRYRSDDIDSKDAWCLLLYERSVFSKAFPVGSEVEVAYDPDDPQGNNCVLTPRGVEPFSDGLFTPSVVLAIVMYSFYGGCIALMAYLVLMMG